MYTHIHMKTSLQLHNITKITKGLNFATRKQQSAE